MDFNKVYESKDNDSILNRQYIHDSEGGEYSWDFDSMKDNIHNSSPEYWEGMEDYKDIDDHESLQSWWSAHYDPKGLAFSYTFHNSILDDVKDMIAEYNRTCEHHNHTPLTEIERDQVITNPNNGEEEAIVVIGVDGALVEEEKEYFEEEVLYNYRGVPVKDAYFDEDSGTFVMAWGTDCLKTGAL